MKSNAESAVDNFKHEIQRLIKEEEGERTKAVAHCQESLGHPIKFPAALGMKCRVEGRINLLSHLINYLRIEEDYWRVFGNK